MRENELDRNSLPFDVEQTIGKVERAVLECPGVYYLQVDDSISMDHRKQNPDGTEFYVVTDEATMISKEARQYGKPVCDQPGLRLYSLANEKSGSDIIDYEINKYRVQNNLPLAPTETLRSLALFATELHPEYFGEYPVPTVTPWGYTTRHKRIDNGVYWIETDLCREVLAVCYPLRGELSKNTAKLAKRVHPDNGMDYLFFQEADMCLPIFELMSLRPEWSGTVDENALMNAILKDHPKYAAEHNKMEQDMQCNQAGAMEKMIVSYPNVGENFLMLWHDISMPDWEDF